MSGRICKRIVENDQGADRNENLLTNGGLIWHYTIIRTMNSLKLPSQAWAKLIEVALQIIILQASVIVDIACETLIRCPGFGQFVMAGNVYRRLHL